MNTEYEPDIPDTKPRKINPWVLPLVASLIGGGASWWAADKVSDMDISFNDKEVVEKSVDSVEKPQIHCREKIVEVPKIIYKDKVIEVPKIVYKDDEKTLQASYKLGYDEGYREAQDVPFDLERLPVGCHKAGKKFIAVNETTLMGKYYAVCTLQKDGSYEMVYHRSEKDYFNRKCMSQRQIAL